MNSELRARRQAAGLTLERSAELLGVSLRTFQAWEAGERPMPYAARTLYYLLTDPEVMKKAATRAGDDAVA